MCHADYTHLVEHNAKTASVIINFYFIHLISSKHREIRNCLAIDISFKKTNSDTGYDTWPQKYMYDSIAFLLTVYTDQARKSSIALKKLSLTAMISN